MYSFTEVAHLSHVSVSTVRNWLRGYVTKQGEVEPLFKGHPEEEKACSFLQLIEIVVAAQFRKAERVSFQTVRYAYDNAQEQWNLEYPFAHLELQALGGHIIHVIRQRGPKISLQAIDQPSHWTLPGLVRETIDQLDYEQELAARWYPAGKNIPIVVDPQISGGLPVVKGRGVTIEAIHKRFKAGQKMDFIAGDFELDFTVIEEVIRYREKLAV
ncbi:MAG: DUF433 domain-containing protein [Dehalococcoidia bacterium]|nr:DUF433 domain-containing protein [Chloroflexota bacterium]MCK4242855.1 DUF433 domain-containing protein [Dehalococcoidia bacterium]